jgi:pyruvate dehydrogenase E2 component (dihydrolipoyllysine-residue acetyltransferase)
MGVFAMPSLGADMESAVLVEWLKAAGDAVKRGDIIAVVETDKGAIEIEIFEDGEITDILVEEGERVPVGAPLATILVEGEAAVEPAVPDTTVEKADVTPPVQSGPVLKPQSVDESSPERASPAARQFAREHRIDLAAVQGSGPDGAIRLVDLQEVELRPPTRGIDPEAMRHAIAAAMSRSKREIPHYYMNHRMDVSAAQLWLDDYNADRPPPERILFGALLVKAVASAVHEFPEFNGVYEADGFIPSKTVNAGVAISIRGGGLVAPAIQNADALSLSELMTQMRDLVGRVRRGSFRASELTSSTITVNSLGDRGVEGVFPIIYPPQVAIIGFGKVSRRPWVIEDEVLPRPVLHMTLAADHRASDGHRGGLFLNAIADQIASPEAL